MNVRKLSVVNQLSIALAVVVVLVLGGLVTLATKISHENAVEVTQVDLTRQVNLLDLNLEVSYQTLMQQNVSLSQIFLELFAQGNFHNDSGAMVEVNGEQVPALEFRKELGAFQDLNQGFNNRTSEFEGALLANDFSYPDEFTRMTGASATIFQRVGDDFLRISTSLRKEDGSRAYGTWLGQGHPGYELLMKGEPYVGKALLFGTSYMTRYVPFRDQDGEVAGILYTGMEYDTQLQLLKDGLNSIAVGETGYIYAIDASEGPSRGQLVIHPSLVGTDILSLEDASGDLVFQKLLELDEGILTYPWADAEGTVNDKIVAFTHVDGWNWVLATGSYVKEFTVQADQLRNELIMAGLVAGVLILLLVYLVLRQQLSPLGAISEVIQRFGAGDFSADRALSAWAVEGSTQNEISRLASESQRMSQSLRALVGDVNHSVASLVQAVQRVSGASAKTRDSVQRQLENTDEVATAIAQVSNSVQGVADNAGSAAAETQHADEKANLGQQVVASVIQSIEGLAREVEDSAQVISRVREESDNIGSVIEVIQNIAEQTNLLALNAAIEAARAGEQGRGFAVVADEVRNLAQRTQNSTTEINDMIQKLQAASMDAVATMERSRSNTQDSVAQVAEAGEHLSGIAQSTSAINGVTSQIAAASEEQMRSVNEVNQNILAIRNMTEQTSRSAEEVDQASDALQTVADGLRVAAERFRV